MAATLNTVPQVLSSRLMEFCQTISSSEPIFISSIPVRGSRVSFCFENVERKVQRIGGSIAYGWAIWNRPSLYFEAEHHAVWCNKSGKLIDVSPQMGDRRSMLFLPDQSAKYDPMRPRSNIMHPDGQSSEALEWVGLGNRRISLLMRCRVEGTSEIRLLDADQIELAELDRKIQKLLTA